MTTPIPAPALPLDQAHSIATHIPGATVQPSPDGQASVSWRPTACMEHGAIVVYSDGLSTVHLAGVTRPTIDAVLDALDTEEAHAIAEAPLTVEQIARLRAHADRVEANGARYAAEYGAEHRLVRMKDEEARRCRARAAAAEAVLAVREGHVQRPVDMPRG